MKKNAHFLFLLALISAYIVIFSSLTLHRHWSLGSYYFDLGILHQTVYNSAHGHFLEMTDTDSVNQILRFAIHFDPLMLVFVPVYWIYSSPEVLLVGQTIALALGAIPLFFIGKDIFKKYHVKHGESIALFFSFLYLNYYPLQNANLADFHPVMLVTPLLLAMFYFVERGKYGWSLLFFFLSLLGKENVGFTTMMIGLYICFFKKQYRWGSFIVVSSMVFFYLVVGFLIPSQRDNIHFAAGYYSKDIVTNIQRLFSMDTISYTYKLFEPLGFISLFAPLMLMIAGPEWGINVLSKNPDMRNLQYHYTALLIPVIFIAGIYGYKNFYLYFQKIHGGTFLKKSTTALLFIVFLFNIYTSYHYSPLSYSYTYDTKKIAAVRLWQRRLANPEVRVSTSGHLAPYFSGRRYFYNFLFDYSFYKFDQTEEDIKKIVSRYEQAQYVILEKSEVTQKHSLVKYYYDNIKNNSAYEKVFDKDGLEVYHKIGTPSL